MIAVAMAVAALITIPRVAGGRQSLDAIERVASALRAADDERTRLAAALSASTLEAARLRRDVDVAASLDLDTVLARALDAALALSGVDAAAVALPPLSPAQEPIFATVGISASEVASQPIESRGDGFARSMSFAYRYTADAPSSGLVRGGAVARLGGPAEEPVGSLAVFWRTSRVAGAELLDELEELAESCGPPVANARRHRDALSRAEIDALTGLHNQRFFHEELAREIARTHRYSRRLALILLDVDNFKSVNDRLGHLVGDATLAEIGDRILSVLRAADIACRVGGDEFGIVMPESGAAEADQLFSRVSSALAVRSPADHLTVSAGIAELIADEDVGSFFRRADEALFAAKRLGKAQSVIADGHQRPSLVEFDHGEGPRAQT